ncbi:major facilitator superfamily domain-containing protein [Dendryphion nanum]|uniref:Major facilitator superfamily domain-containing protein n=1 Tax=Dendryphion nanum TaxID=256645 RepID=A0A9P9IQW5_9PLEO|nr:major facilitator superfamily domain-containing protein [Dendryphion nanum]
MSDNPPFNPEPSGNTNVKEKYSSSNSTTSPPNDERTGSQERLADESGARDYSTWQWLLVCLAIYSSSFLYGLDNAIVADIQGSLIEDLGEVGKLGWLAIGFPLGSVATILSFGKAYGVFDIKWLYVGSMTMFTAGSALCGAAPALMQNMDALIIGRVWAGVGGAGMYLGVLNLVTVNTSLRERPLYMSINGLVWGVGCVLGPVIGGAFADSPATWRWAFYLNLVIFAIFAPGLIFILRPVSFMPDVPFTEKLLNMDWVGITLNAALYTIFVMVFTLAGVQWAWSDGRIITLFVVLGVLLIAFIASQYFEILSSRANRIFPGDFLRNRTLILLYICQACAATTLFVPIYYIPLFFQLAHGEGGVQSAIRLIPFVIIAVAASMFQGAMMPRFGYCAPWFFVASVFAVISGALFYGAVEVDTPHSHIYGFSVLLGLGAGFSQQAAYSMAAAEVPPNRVSDAVGFINTAQIGSSVIALTIASAVFQNVGTHRVSNAMQGLGYSTSEMHDALAGKQSVVFLEVTDEVRQRIVEGIVQTINEEYILIIAAGAVGTFASIFLSWKRMIVDSTVVGAM